VTIPIDGLYCGGALTIERELASLPGVIRAYVNPLTEMAYVAFDPSASSASQIQVAIRELGYWPGEPQIRERS
jgi:cation transport ATPase